jgi:DNA-binding HxlR family transcriptional regulator
VLSRELKTLAAFGLITRTEYQVVPPRVEYCLTSLGQSLLPIVSSIIAWGKEHLLDDGALALNDE